MKDEFSISLGYAVKSGHRYDLSEYERARHLYTIGRTGAGKSTLQRSLILQDIHAGRGVTLIDPCQRRFKSAPFGRLKRDPPKRLAGWDARSPQIAQAWPSLRGWV